MSEGLDREKNIRGWAIVLVSFLILVLIFASCISCMGVYVKPVTNDLNISRTDFSMINAVRSFGMVISAVIAGKLMERYNVKYLMLLGVFACSGGLFIYATASKLIYFYTAAMLIGFSISFTCNVPISILIKNWFRSGNEGTALGVAFVGSGAGAMVLNPLYTIIIENYGWRYSFALTGICVLVILVPLVLFVISDSPEKAARIDKNVIEADKARSCEDDDEYGFTFWDVLKKPRTWAMFFAYSSLTLAGMGVLQHGVPYMTDCGISAGRAAMVISAGSAVLVIGKIVAGRMYDKFGVYKMNMIETCLLVLCFIAFCIGGAAGASVMMILFILLYGIGMPVGTISVQLTLPYMYGKGNFGSLMGVFSMTNGVGGMLQVLIGVIYDQTGSYYPAWMMMAVLCALATLVFATCGRPVRSGMAEAL